MGGGHEIEILKPFKNLRHCFMPHDAAKHSSSIMTYIVSGERRNLKRLEQCAIHLTCFIVLE